MTTPDVSPAVESGVQRFGLFWSADKPRNGVMEEFDHGNWVQASDYNAMLAQLVLANETIEQLRLSETAGTLQTWQPIHTAPKDGDSILVSCPGVGTAYWSYFGDAQGYWSWHRGGRCNPTHWMPLPEGPK